MTTRPWLKHLCAALLCLAAAACGKDGGGGTQPTPGVLTVSLAGTAAPRALLLEVSGPGISAPQAAEGGYVLHHRAAGSTLRAAVFGELHGGALLRFSVPDVNKPQLYTVRVVEAADAQNQLLADGGGLQLTVAR